MPDKSVFQETPKSDWLYETSHFYVIEDKYPVNPGHLLIVSKEYFSDFFELGEEGKKQLTEVITRCKQLIENRHSPDGYNIGMNCGEKAGQTVFHFHCHVIPRYKGDMEDPTGGIRHCVAGKGYY